MTEITARLHSHLPFTLAAQYLREGLTQISNTGPQHMHVTTRLPATQIVLSKDVVAECTPDPADPERAWRIHWTPEPGGVYPSFDGRLSAFAEERDGTTILELTGHYKPPLGIAGEVFDHIAGRKMTTETAHDFLANVAGEMKVRFAFEEAREIFQEEPERRNEFPAPQ